MLPQQEEGLAEIFQMSALKDVAQSPLPVGAGSGPAWLRGLQGRCTKGLSLPGDLSPRPWSLPACPICKLQSRLSASTAEIRAPYFCLLPPEPGRPELRLEQTLWHHRAECWGNLVLFWELLEEGSDNFQLRKRKKKKEERTHHKNSCRRVVRRIHGMLWAEPHGQAARCCWGLTRVL